MAFPLGARSDAAAHLRPLLSSVGGRGAMALPSPLLGACPEDDKGPVAAGGGAVGAPSRDPSPEPSPERCSARELRELPDLMGRIRDMGLVDEYVAFRERYLGWRAGEARGARGEPTAAQLPLPTMAAANRGWGYWYPTLKEWQWSRTMSYWIAVTFFEGAIFFFASSFLYNYPGDLGVFFRPVTLWGYVAGKFLFLICTYLMCLDVINLRHDSCSDGRSTGPTFYYMPFRYRVAFDNLKAAGVGPWPYLAAALYFGGVLLFTVGLAVELAPVLPLEAEQLVLHCSFVAGSLSFVAGSLAECIENGTFQTLSLDKGSAAALLNLLGSLGFLVGSIIGWCGSDWWAQISFGVGSGIFLVGSSVQITMWKDEQFGLSFLAELNRLGGPQGRPVRAGGAGDQPREVTSFTVRGLIFVHLYCLGGALSTYNFSVQLQRFMVDQHWKSLWLAFNELWPCLISHMLLLLSSAVAEIPKATPFKELSIGARWVYLAILANTSAIFLNFLVDAFTPQP